MSHESTGGAARTLATFALIVALFFSFSSSARAVADHLTTQEQINNLMQLIANLQAQLSALQGGSGTGASCPQITRSLYIGLSDAETGGEVTLLQKFLGVSPTGFFGPQTELKVKEWQKNKGIVSSGTADTTGYGFVGEKTRSMMRGGCVPTPGPVVIAPSLSVVERSTSNNVVNYRLSVPASYAGKHVVLILNPEKVTKPISSGELTTWQIASDWKGGTMTGEVGVQSAHQGFASNDGGVHWFNTVPGTYSLAVAFYTARPFKSGTDMEYHDVAKLDTLGFGLPVRSRSFAITSENEPSCTIKTSDATPDVGERFTISWTTKNIENPVFQENFKGGGEYEVEERGSLTFTEKSVYTTTVGIGDGYDSDPICEVELRIGGEELSGTIFNESLKTYNENPFITGTASGATHVVFSMSKSGKSMYDSGRIAVVYNTGRLGGTEGVWSHRISTELDPGTYRMSLYASDSSTEQGKLLDTETLTVHHDPVINEFSLDWEGDFKATFSWDTDETDQCYIARINENRSRFVIANELESTGEYTATIARGSDGGALDHALVCVGEPTSDGKDSPSVEQLIDWKG